jgi:hypothetical protein
VPAESIEPISKTMGIWPIWEKGQEVYSRFLGHGEVIGAQGQRRVYVQFNNGNGAPVFISSTHLQEKPDDLIEADNSWMEEIDF